MADIYLPGPAVTQFGTFAAGPNLNVPDTVAGFLALRHGAVAYDKNAAVGSQPLVVSAQKAALLDSLVSGGGNAQILSITPTTGLIVGALMTATPNTGWTVSGYQWTRDGVDISGATSSTYTLTLADEGALLGVRATSPVYTALIEIPPGTYPAGYLSLDGGVMSLDGGVLSLV